MMFQGRNFSARVEGLTIELFRETYHLLLLWNNSSVFDNFWAKAYTVLYSVNKDSKGSFDPESNNH